MYVLNVFFERIFNALVHFLLTISYNLQIPTYYKVVVIYCADRNERNDLSSI